MILMQEVSEHILKDPCTRTSSVNAELIAEKRGRRPTTTFCQSSLIKVIIPCDAPLSGLQKRNGSGHRTKPLPEVKSPAKGSECLELRLPTAGRCRREGCTAAARPGGRRSSLRFPLKSSRVLQLPFHPIIVKANAGGDPLLFFEAPSHSLAYAICCKLYLLLL